MNYETIRHILCPEKYFSLHKLDDDPDPDCEICKETTGIYRHEFDKYLCDDDYDLMREKLLK